MTSARPYLLHVDGPTTRPGGIAEQKIKTSDSTLSISKEAPIRTDSVASSPEKQADLPLVDTPHEDERQVGLDTNRSFVLYPVGKLCSTACTSNIY